MKSNYKTLGEYIQIVNVKNNDLSITKLLGISISKMFITSIANTIGTDLSNYKVVEKNQFAYGPVTSRNGNKISIALLNVNECIISSSYTVFEIKDHTQLLPEYLMMWFSRQEFDRYARFNSHGSVREIFSWDEMCNVWLPVPPIEKQQKIVNAYKVVTDRIALLENINEKLEEIASNYFKDSTNMYESNELIYLKNYGIVITGKTPDTSNVNYYGNEIPFVKTPDLHDKIFLTATKNSLTKLGADTQKNKYIPQNSILVACIGHSTGAIGITTQTVQTNQQINAVISDYPLFLYFSIKLTKQELITLGEGSSTMTNVNKKSFENHLILNIPITSLLEIEKNLSNLLRNNKHNQLEIEKLRKLQNLLLTSLATE